MKISRREDGKLERTIIISMIVDKTVLGSISQKWDGRLFGSRWGNLIGDWCVEFYKKYRKAPGKDIEGIYDQWAARRRDEDTKEMVEKLLQSLSGQWQRTAKQVQSDYVLDLAAKQFTRVRVANLKEMVDGLLEEGDVDEAVKEIKKFHHVEIGQDGYVDLFSDMEAVEQAMDETELPPLIKYGGALNRFFKGFMTRDMFIAFEGPEKRGKCVHENMKVLLADGRLSTIKRMVESEDKTPVISLNESTGGFEQAEVTQFWDNGVKKCWRVRTRTGRSVSTTDNHKYLTPDGWKEIKDVRVGNYIAVPKSVSFFGSKPEDPLKVRFLAYMLAEGCSTTTSLTFTNTDPILLDDFQLCCENLGVVCKWTKFRPGFVQSLRLTNAGQLVRSLGGLWKRSSKTKFIPPWVFQLPKEQVAEFLRVFFSCDGGIHLGRNRNCVELCLANRRLIRQISHLLLRFGIVHKTCPKEVKLNGNRFKAWRISIRSEVYVNLFLKEINFLSYKRTEPRTTDVHKSFLDKLPWQIADKLYQDLKRELPKGEFYKRFGKKKAGHVRWQICQKLPLMRQSFIHMRNTESYRKYLDSDILWDEVVSIKYAGEHKTYDLGIPEHHNFVANDCIVHNTYWLMDTAWRGVVQKRRVAFFEIGDLSRNQILRRFYNRVAGRPLYKTEEADPDTVVKYPVSILPPDNPKSFAQVEHADRTYPRKLNKEDIKRKCHSAMRKHGKDLLRIATYPNNTISVSGIQSVLNDWQRDGWHPDIIIIDYADLLSPMGGGKLESRDQIDLTWKSLRGMSQTEHCLLVTASQTDTASYDTDVLSMSNFSGDKRKNAHVRGMIGLNQKPEEKEIGVTRLNWINLGEGKTSTGKCCHVAGCLALARPAILSVF